MPKMVEVPGYDQPVEFPDSMSNEDISAVLRKQVQKQGAPSLKSSHEPYFSKPQMATSHEQPPAMENRGGAAKAPAIDPGTGRQQTAGRTMTEEETAHYRTATMVAVGATVGSMGLGAAVAPLLAFTRAGAGTSFAFQAGARLLGAAVGGGGGEAYGQLFEHAHGVGPASSGEAATRIGESAKDQAEFEALGLGVEGAFKLAAGGVKAGGSKLYEALKQTSVYDKIMASKAAAATERNIVVTKKAAETAEGVANSFMSPPAPGMLEVRGPGLIKEAEASISKNVNTMYEGFKAAINDKRIDYRDVADMVVSVEEKTPRARGGLRVMTEPDPQWAEFVDAMKAGNKEQSSVYQKAVPPQPIKSGPVYGSKTSFTDKTAPAGEKVKLSSGGVDVDPVTGAPRMTPGKPEVKKFLAAPNSAELAPAVVDARGTISQRIADLEKSGNAPREYVEGLKKSLALLDTKLEAAAAEIGPGGPELFKAAKQYFGQSREIQKQAMYRLMKTGGDVARALMDPAAPEGVAVLKAVAREAGDETLLPTAQRAVIEKLLDPTGKGVDLARFNDKLRGLGKTGEHLFSDPRAAGVISGIKEQAAVLNQLEAVPTLSGKSGEKMAVELLIHALGSVAGYAVGSKALPQGAHGGWVGAALGGAYAGKVTGVMLRLAENPQANRMFLSALKMTDKTGEFSGQAVTLATRALKMVGKSPLGEEKVKSENQAVQK